jgi:ERCC4-type nuclease
MILIDSRVGSRELMQGIRKLGVDCELAGMLAADFQFVGEGPVGSVLIGIERKQISDMLQSMRDRRLAGQQLSAMTSCYDVCVLIVEGIWRRQRDTGFVEVLNGSWRAARGSYHYAELDKFLCSLEQLAGLRIRRTADEEETCAQIADLYSWWQKDYEDHKSLDAIYAPPPDTRVQRGHRAVVFHREPTLKEKWAAQLPGVDSRAIQVAASFESAREMANADVERWLQVGHRIGKKTAEGIVEAIRHEV